MDVTPQTLLDASAGALGLAALFHSVNANTVDLIFSAAAVILSFVAARLARRHRKSKPRKPRKPKPTI